MARIASDLRVLLPVTGDTPLHAGRMQRPTFVLNHHIPVTRSALDLADRVPRVAEENKIRQLKYTRRWKLPVDHIHVADLALCARWVSRAIAPFGVVMAKRALQFQGRVPLVTERRLIVISAERYGKQ
jgi:hypothetical protein